MRPILIMILLFWNGVFDQSRANTLPKIEKLFLGCNEAG